MRLGTLSIGCLLWRKYETGDWSYQWTINIKTGIWHPWEPRWLYIFRTSKVYVYPHTATYGKAKRKRFIQELPDCLTSPDTMRKMTLRDLAKVKLTANREKSAKLRFERDLAKKKQRLSTKPGKRNRGQLKTKAVEQEQQTDEGSIQCMDCHMSW